MRGRGVMSGENDTGVLAEAEEPAFDMQGRFGNYRLAENLTNIDFGLGAEEPQQFIVDRPVEEIQGPLPAGETRVQGALQVIQTDASNVSIEYGTSSLKIRAAEGGRYTYFIDPPATKPPEPSPLQFLSDQPREEILPQITIRVAVSSIEKVDVDWDRGPMLHGMPLVVQTRYFGEDLETAPSMFGTVEEFGILESGMTLTLDRTVVHMIGETPDARVAYWFEPEWTGPMGLDKIVYIVAGPGVRVRMMDRQWAPLREYGRTLLPQVIRVPHPSMVPPQGEPIDPAEYTGMQYVSNQPASAQMEITPAGVQIVEAPPTVEKAQESLIQLAQGFSGTSIVHPWSNTRIRLHPTDAEVGAAYAWQLIAPGETTGEIRIVCGPGTFIETSSPPPYSYFKKQGAAPMMPGSNWFADDIPNNPIETLKDSAVELHIVEVTDAARVPPPGTPININYYLQWGHEREPDIHNWLDTSNLAFDLQTTGLDVAVGMIPIVGDLVDIGEFFFALATDRDRWGRKVDTGDKILMGLGAVIGLIPFLGGIGSLLRGGTKVGTHIAEIARVWGKTEEQLEALIWRVKKAAHGDDAAIVDRAVNAMRTGEEIATEDVSHLNRLLKDVGAGEHTITTTLHITDVATLGRVENAAEAITDSGAVTRIVQQASQTGEINASAITALERSGMVHDAEEARAVLQQSMLDASAAGHANPEDVGTAIGRLEEAIPDGAFQPAERMGTVTFSGRMKRPREHPQRNPEVTYRRGAGPLVDLEPDPSSAARIEQSALSLDEAFESVGWADAERGKTFATSGAGANVSGYTFVPERQVTATSPANVRARANQIGHPVRGNPHDQGVRGQYFDSHAEKKQIVSTPDQPVGVNRPMCHDCIGFFSREAEARGTRQIVSDPFTTRAFDPDGTITEYWRDGSVIRINPDGTVNALPSTMRTP